MTGLSEAELAYVECADTLARIALGAVTTAGRTMLHELVHDQKGLNYKHCPNRCCMQRIALKWQCRVTSKLGLYRADNHVVDVLGPAADDPANLEYASNCRDENPSSNDDANFFRGTCRMEFPGQHSNSDNFTEGGEQEREDGSRVTCTDSQGNPDFCNPEGCEQCD